MAVYQSLYRKYRPQRFGELVGQEHVTTALRNAVREERVGHAYLFSGPAGHGQDDHGAHPRQGAQLPRTSVPTASPAACARTASPSPRAGSSTSSSSTPRRTTASTTSATSPIACSLGLGATSRRKVYLVDEVHMLSAAASNALLKTLEEPPDHVVFVLATTNPEKVLPTIRSRTQHFEFTLLTADEIAEDATPGDRGGGDRGELRRRSASIARAGAGSVRDALSLLDQALAHSSGPLDPGGRVRPVRRARPFDVRVAILEAIAAEDASTVLVTLGELLDSGHEPRRIAEDLLRTIRDAFLLNAAGDRRASKRRPRSRRGCASVGEALGNALARPRPRDASGRRSSTCAAPTPPTRGSSSRSRWCDWRGATAARRSQAVIERRRHGSSSAVTELRARSARSRPPSRRRHDAIDEDQRQGSGRHHRGAAQAASARGGERARRCRRGAAGASRARASRAEAGGGASAREPGIPARSEQRPANDVQLDDVIVAWAEILPSLPVATRRGPGGAAPRARHESDVITFGDPAAQIVEARSRGSSGKRTRIRDDAHRACSGASSGSSVVAHELRSGAAPDRACGRSSRADDRRARPTPSPTTPTSTRRSRASSSTRLPTTPR